MTESLSSPSATGSDLSDALASALSTLEQVSERATGAMRIEEVGSVIHVGHGIARVRGLPGVRSQELLRFAGGVTGVAFNLEPDVVGAVLHGESPLLRAGSEVRRTGRVESAPVSESLLGRVLSPSGKALDGRGAIRAAEWRPVEREAPPIMARAPVSVPLQTGIKAVDALIPIGRGQRELILGDRQTGKTALAVDTIINQHGKSVLCIYCGIGKRSSALAGVIADLEAHDALEYSLVVASTEEDPPGLQFVAPYAATTMAEFFMERGRDVLVVLDDLTRHARAYRELSLLLRRPPGREAYPGDIFYIHSRLLERYTHLRDERGGGSLTALPIIETEAEDLSAYIPTNLISITDGQIYLSPRLFQKGLLPAVDVSKSVSRVGGKTQLPAYRKVAGDLRLAYSQFEELEAFSRFGTRLDEQTRESLDRGRRVREVLKQPQYSPLDVAEQVAVLIALNEGVLDGADLDAIGDLEAVVRGRVLEALPALCERIRSGEELSDDDISELENEARRAIEEHRA